MGRRGPLPAPTNVQKQRGTRGAKAREGTEPTPPPGRPRRPAWLRPKARTVWDALVSLLDGAGVLTVIDGNVLARYCQLWARWREVEDDLAKDGQTTVNRFGEPIAQPGVRIANALAVQLRQLEGELGMSPAARVRLQVDKQADTRDELDKALDAQALKIAGKK